MNRRHFLKNTASAGFALQLFGSNFIYENLTSNDPVKPFFKISLAQWSLHDALFSGRLDAMDFPKKAKQLGFEAVEYVSQFYNKEAEDTIAFTNRIKELRNRSKDEGIHNVLIMVDGEGALASANAKERGQAIAKHQRWLDAASTLGCHSIRVNLFGGPEDNIPAWKDAAAAGLSKLCTNAARQSLNVIVENHGGLSSNAAALSDVMHMVNLKNCGTLPDFGNFCIKREDKGNTPNPCINEYDRYKGVEEMMPFAKGVSAKTFDFDAHGNETSMDYLRLLHIVKNHGYKGYIGIEYEGSGLSEEQGILATRELLMRVAKEIK
jgi:sugar phosphate isomerase/epimerase